jgi:hypothetical protein
MYSGKIAVPPGGGGIVIIRERVVYSIKYQNMQSNPLKYATICTINPK